MYGSLNLLLVKYGGLLKELLKLLPIYTTLFSAQFIFSYVNYTFIFSKIKSGVFHLPLFGDFTPWWKFVIMAWLFNAPAFIFGTVLVVWSMKLSLDNFGAAYTSIIASQIISVIMTLFFMWYRMGELPSRNGWIALILVFIASLLTASSGKKV